MGTESEALRWKQWIDRWIKISSPEVGSTINSSASSSKIDVTAASGHRKSLLTTEQLRYQLINMVKVIPSLRNEIHFFEFYLFRRKVIQFFAKVFVENY